MASFQLIFDLLMTVWPFAFVVLFPAKPALAGDRLRAYKRRLSWLALATAASWCLIAVMHFSVSQSYPLWTLCFALWFGGAMPIMRDKRRDWRDAHTPHTTTRRASLRSRVHVSPVPAAWWLTAWTVWVLLLAATVQQLPSLQGFRV